MKYRRIAVLVDGDNVSSKHSAQIISEAEKLGRIDVARVYTATNPSSDWLMTPGYRLMHAGVGKNAADLLLSIDAMELALVGGIDAFVVATSDRDFTHLAQRLRERGLYVLGLGEQKAPEDFRLSCTEFHLLTKKKNSQHSVAKASGVSELDQKIRCMIAQYSTGGRGIRISELAPKMHAAHGTRISAYPERNWRTYLSARPTLYEIDPRGPEAMVRFRPRGFSPS